MYIEFVYGPKTQTREHVSREVGAALITGGFAIELPSVIDPVDVARKCHPPAGWSIVRGGQYGTKIFMRFDDGSGGRTLLDQVPPLKRTYIPPNPATGETEGTYEMRPAIEIPPDVLAEFRRAGGGPKDEFADFDAGESRQQKLARLQAEQDQQNRVPVPRY